MKPGYTRSALARKVEGNVVLECTVLTDGSVGECKVIRALDPDLDEEALAAARRWRFSPGKRNGVAVPVVVTLELTFTLRGQMEAWPATSPPDAAPPAKALLAPPGFAKGQRYVLDGSVGFDPARLVFKYPGDGPLEAELTVEGLQGFRQPIRLKGSLVGNTLRLAFGDLTLEGIFNGRQVTGSYAGKNTGGTFTLATR